MAHELTTFHPPEPDVCCTRFRSFRYVAGFVWHGAGVARGAESRVRP